MATIANVELAEIVYKLVITARMSASNEAYKKCLGDLTQLKGFSFSGRDEEKQITEYRHLVAGKTKCKLQISPKELAAETLRDGNVEEDSWKKWSENILEIVAPAMDGSSKDLSVLAMVREYRFPKIGNNYAFLRDAFFTNSRFHKLLDNLKLLDTEIMIKSVLDEEVKLFLEITSNQQMDEILGDALDDEDNRITFKFHAVRLDLKCYLKVVDAMKIQDSKLKAWLEAGKLATILEAFGSK